MHTNIDKLYFVVKKIALNNHKDSFDKILDMIESEGYKIELTDYHSDVGEIKTFKHFNDSRYPNSNRRIIFINPNLEPHLQGDNTNFIWGLIHEVGHMLTVGIRYGDDEMREVIAWDMAQYLINCELTELKSSLNSFEERAIHSLKDYWDNPESNWDNYYQWTTDKDGQRILKRIANSSKSI